METLVEKIKLTESGDRLDVSGYLEAASMDVSRKTVRI